MGVASSLDWPEVVREYSPQLYRLALHTIGRREDAEDVVQETFLRAYQAIERRGVRVHTSMRAWLGRIAVNLCYDRLRRRSRAETPAGATGEVFSALSVDETSAWEGRRDPGPEQAVIEAETAHDLARALEFLPENHRSAVILRYGMDLSYREIARALGVPENTVATWLRRAHIALRRKARLEEGAPCTAG
jgi:RNA polymerase sigma-70 factor (ECF subfamily)